MYPLHVLFFKIRPVTVDFYMPKKNISIFSDKGRITVSFLAIIIVERNIKIYFKMIMKDD